MKSLLRRLPFFGFFLLCLFGCQAQAEQTNDSNSRTRAIFWEICKPGSSETSYLYGSIHIQDKRVFAFAPFVWEKLAQCEYFSPEINLDLVSPFEMIRYMKMPIPYDSLLSAEELVILKNACDQFGIVKYAAAKKIKPFFLGTLFATSFIPKDEPEALDAFFLKKAIRSKKKIAPLETIDEQMQFISSIPLHTQVKMLMESLHNLDTAKMRKDFNQLLDPYLNEDSETLWELTVDTSRSSSNIDFVESFILKRNHKMAQRLDSLLQKGKVFCVIGAAHLGGTEGVVALLKKRGYQVDPLAIGLKKKED